MGRDAGGSAHCQRLRDRKHRERSGGNFLPDQTSSSCGSNIFPPCAVKCKVLRALEYACGVPRPAWIHSSHSSRQRTEITRAGVLLCIPPKARPRLCWTMVGWPRDQIPDQRGQGSVPLSSHLTKG